MLIKGCVSARMRPRKIQVKLISSNVGKYKSEQIRKMGTIKKIFSLFFFLQAFTSQSFLFSQVSAKDQVTDTVQCRNEIGQSYALYRPAQYDNKKSWPVILIFDPSARGRTGVSNFIEAGRKYGFILACSNNSRNGPLGDNFTTFRRNILKFISFLGARKNN